LAAQRAKRRQLKLNLYTVMMAFLRHCLLSVGLYLNRVFFNLGASLAPHRHHPCAKQVNAGPAIHGPLKRLQPVDLPLRPTFAPGFQHGIANGLDILP
jgi:hypothetical protein